MKIMRTSLLYAALAVALLSTATSTYAQDSSVISGKLKQTLSGPLLQTPKGDIRIESDQESDAVLRDGRLKGLQVEATGHFRDETHFQLAPFHKKPLRVVQNGKKQEVTYWCNVCSIRTYTPGRCLCCQEETALDLKDSQ